MIVKGLKGLSKGFKNLIAVYAASGLEFDQAKAILSAAKNAPAAGGGGGGADAEQKAKNSDKLFTLPNYIFEATAKVIA